MILYKQTIYIKVNDKYKYNVINKYSIYELHDDEQIFNFDTFVEFLEKNRLSWVSVRYNWKEILTKLYFHPSNYYSKKKIENIKLYTVTEVIDSRDCKMDDLRKWLNADEFIEYITRTQININKFIN